MTVLERITAAQEASPAPIEEREPFDHRGLLLFKLLIAAVYAALAIIFAAWVGWL